MFHAMRSATRKVHQMKAAKAYSRKSHPYRWYSVTVITKNRFPMKPKHQILKAAATEPDRQAVAVSPAGALLVGRQFGSLCLPPRCVTSALKNIWTICLFTFSSTAAADGAIASYDRGIANLLVETAAD